MAGALSGPFGKFFKQHGAVVPKRLALERSFQHGSLRNSPNLALLGKSVFRVHADYHGTNIIEHMTPLHVLLAH